MSYTDKQKVAYYKRLYQQSRSRPSYTKKRNFSRKKTTTRGRYVNRRPRKNTGVGIGSSIKSIGNTISQITGSSIPRTIGDIVGNGIQYFTGRGAYEVKENIFLKNGNPDMPPIVNSDNGGGVIVRRSEYLCDIITSDTAGAFNIQSFFINPGLAESFQWLSQIAPNFEEYVPEGIYYEFKSTSSDALNSTNTALGTVIMAAEYNSILPNFTSKQAMENYEGGISCKPSCSMRYFVECARNRTVLSDLYTRSGSVPPGTDQRFYDLANFQIATYGMQGTSVNVGELWVTYQFSLRKPKLSSIFGNSIFFTQALFTGIDNSNPLGTAITYSQGTTWPFLSNTNTVLALQSYGVPLSFYFNVTWSGSSSVSVLMPTLTFSDGITATLIAAIGNTVSIGTCSKSYYLQIDANTLTTITFSTASIALPTGSPVCLLYMVQIPSSFVPI